LLQLALAASLAQAPSPLDAGAFLDSLRLLTDGQGHYVAYDPERPYGDQLFYGNGKTFARVPTSGGGKSGTERWNANFWDPRAYGTSLSPPSIDMKDSGKTFTVTCAKRTTALNPVAPEEAAKLLAGATFTEPTWTRMPERLLRDDTGIYYFVDRYRTRERADRRDFRVFLGQRGNMVQMPLKDIVDDSQGMIFATKTGNLRLITARPRAPGCVARSRFLSRRSTWAASTPAASSTSTSGPTPASASAPPATT
jgi:hypothetical protein